MSVHREKQVLRPHCPVGVGEEREREPNEDNCHEGRDHPTMRGIKRNEFASQPRRDHGLNEECEGEPGKRAEKDVRGRKRNS